MNSKGQLPAFLVMFGATIVVVLSLVVFVLGAGVVKKINNAGAGIKVYDEKGVEIDNIFNYMDRYVSLLNVKFFLEKGKTLDDSFKEAGYEK